MKDAFEVRHPIFRPMWRRVLVVAVLSAWTLYEVSQGNWGWAALFGGAILYLAWAFFWAFDKGPAGGEE